MFNSCWLTLSQDSNWVNVKLLTKYSGEVQDSWERVFERIRNISEGYALMGSWKVGDNSRTKEEDTTYTVGSSYHPRHKFWRYSLENRQLDFVEKAHMHGGAGYGNEWDELRVAATLYNARLKPNSGIVPWNGDRNNGFITIGSNVFSKGSLLWEKYQS